jgi:hypothetical protein
MTTTKNTKIGEFLARGLLLSLKSKSKSKSKSKIKRIKENKNSLLFREHFFSQFLKSEKSK